MQKYSVLFVDDEKEMRDAALAVAAESNVVDIVVARNAEEACAQIGVHFFNLAIVDIHLDETGNKPNKDGIIVLRDLFTYRPACRRFLMTSRSKDDNKEYIDALCSALSPYTELAERVIQKEDFGASIRTTITQCASKWLFRQINIEGSDVLAEALRAKAYGPPPRAIVTADEIDYLVSSVFLQGEREFDRVTKTGPHGSDAPHRSPRPHGMNAAVNSQDIDRIVLRLMEGGYGAAVVAQAVPFTHGGKEGVCAVIKIAPIDDAREEVLRFHRFVRFRVSPHRRVELLGYKEGDTCGAMCLSYAGGRHNESLQSLQKLFDTEDDRAISVLNGLLSPNVKDWYAEDGGLISLSDYFTAAWPWKDIRESQKYLQQLEPSIAAKCSGRLQRDEITFDGFKLLRPGRAVGKGIFQRRIESCVVHGDLHGGNVIVGQSEEGILLDFRHVGIGPRCIDFATLESSVRLRTLSDNWTSRDLGRLRRREADVIKRIWGAAVDSSANEDLDREYWETVSFRLGTLARENFPDVTKDEYLATCLLWGFRLITNPHLKSRTTRLYVWMSVVAEALK